MRFTLAPLATFLLALGCTTAPAATDTGSDAATADALAPDAPTSDAFVAPDVFVAPDAFMVPSAQPPVSTGPHATDGTGAVTLAISRLYLGDTTRDGSTSADAWRDFGFDIDHRTSTATSTDLCQPRDGASTAMVGPDGTDGTDNAFGQHVLPILLAISASAAADVNSAIASGMPTRLITIDALGTGAAYDPLVGRMYLSEPLGSAPHFDGTDHYDVDPAALTSPTDLGSAIVTLESAYLVGNTLVARTSGTLEITIGGAAWPISGATIAIELDAAHHQGTRGTISGVVATDAAAAVFRRIAGGLDPSLCMGAVTDSIVAQTRQASDILADGTQDPSMPCDGISIGLGFDAALVQLGAIGAPTPPPADPCPTP